MVASEIPRPAPPRDSGRAIPIQPSFASAAWRDVRREGSVDWDVGVCVRGVHGDMSLFDHVPSSNRH